LIVIKKYYQFYNNYFYWRIYVDGADFVEASKNKTKKGNNGKFFKSAVDKNGVYKWIALKITNKTRRK
jgi:hypothetical protein